MSGFYLLVTVYQTGLLLALGVPSLTFFIVVRAQKGFLFFNPSPLPSFNEGPFKRNKHPDARSSIFCVLL